MPQTTASIHSNSRASSNLPGCGRIMFRIVGCKIRNAGNVLIVDIFILGHGRGFIRVISGANLLINIIEGARKFSGDFATGFSDASGPGYQRVPPLVPWQKFKTSITFATGVRFRPMNYQNEGIDDEYISSISDFAPNIMKHYPATTRYIARRARV